MEHSRFAGGGMVEATGQRAATIAGPLSVDEWVALYSARPVEIANGEIVGVSPPTMEHVLLAHDLYHLLDQHVRMHRLGRVWIEAPYLLEEDDRADWVRGSRVPDVSYVAQERLDAHLKQHGKSGPMRLRPDLAVEIVSPHDSYSALTQKVADYLRYGVRLVWIIDPQTRTIRVHTPDDPDGHTLREGDTLSGAPVLEGWSLLVAEVLGAQGGESQQAE